MEKYIDIPSTIHVLGNIYKDPSLSNDERYPLQLADFYDEFHKAIYTTLYGLYMLGNKTITEIEVNDYISSRPKLEGLFNQNNGIAYLKEIAKNAQASSFKYYYERLKKITLLRTYYNNGINVSDIYNPDEVLNAKLKQEQEDWLDNSSLDEIAGIVENKINDIHAKYIDNSLTEIMPAAEGLENLIEKLSEAPVYGYPLYGDYINTINRGARLGELYLRSSSSGLGKSRSFMADACYIGVSTYYDDKQHEWIQLNPPQDTLLISTEQRIDELQTMMLAFVSGVKEEKILNGEYTDAEYDRVLQSIELINDPEKCKLRFLTLSDFSMNDILNAIKRSIRQYGTKYIFLDYLHSSISILSEIAEKAKGVPLREDQVLFMMTDKLKQIALEYGVFIYTGTQLNADYNKGVYDQNALRGAKSIADKISYGTIMVKATQDDLEAIQPIVMKLGCATPTIKQSVYKNRRSKYQNILLWCEDRRDTSKINPLFATTFNYELIDDLDNIQIKIIDDDIEVKRNK